MVTSNAIQRTFHLHVGGQQATSFCIDVEQREYFVTAKHVLGGIRDRATVQIFHDSQWKDVPIAIVGHAPDPVDISVFVIPKRIMNPAVSLQPDPSGLIVSQDVYFLGFPFGLFGHMGEQNANYPLPFVKKGIVSNIEHIESAVHRIFLDGHNNPGFSGGPVVFAPPGTNNYRAAAVVSGYRYQESPVYHGEAKLPLSSRENTGIVISYGINHAVSLARSNPIGTL